MSVETVVEPKVERTKEEALVVRRVLLREQIDQIPALIAEKSELTQEQIDLRQRLAFVVVRALECGRLVDRREVIEHELEMGAPESMRLTINRLRDELRLAKYDPKIGSSRLEYLYDRILKLGEHFDNTKDESSRREKEQLEKDYRHYQAVQKSIKAELEAALQAAYSA